MITSSVWIWSGIAMLVLIVAVIVLSKIIINKGKRVKELEKVVDLQLERTQELLKELERTKKIMSSLTANNRASDAEARKLIKKTEEIKTSKDFFKQMKENNN